jgi:hypothetical protein
MEKNSGPVSTRNGGDEEKVETTHRSTRSGLWTVIAIIAFGLIFLAGLIAALVTVGHHGRLEPGPPRDAAIQRTTYFGRTEGKA